MAKMSKLLSLVAEASNFHLLYEIIYAIIFGVGAHLGVPGTLKVGQNCQNFKIFVFGRSGLKFSRCSHICYMKLPVQYFWTYIWVPRDYRNWSKLFKFYLFLSLVVEASDFHDLLL